VSRSETQSYFQQRPLGSQLGAWASPQSKVIEDRAFLENNFKNWEEKFAAQSIVEAPDYWGGYVVAPYKIEFWQGRESRLHDRILYTLTQIEPKTWKIERLAP
jgi:pyridoxamine 5'-phosphate oxidase